MNMSQSYSQQQNNTMPYQQQKQQYNPSHSSQQQLQPPIRIQDQETNINSDNIGYSGQHGDQQHLNSIQGYQQNSSQMPQYSQFQSQNQYTDGEYGGTDAMEYTPSISSNRMNNQNNNNISNFQQLSSQQQISNNIMYQLSDPSAQSQDKSNYNNGIGLDSQQQLKQQQQSTQSQAQVKNFDLGNSLQQNDDPALLDDYINQQYNLLQNEQQRGSRQNNVGNTSIRGLSNTSQDRNYSQQQPNMNNQSQLYNSNRSFTSNTTQQNGRNTQQTPGFQSLNQSSERILNPFQNQNINTMNNQNITPLQQQQPAGSLVEQLSQKVKQQAERLQFLENYKTLCERRIRDFDPQHQLPVLPSHIGNKTQQNTQNNNGHNNNNNGILHQKIQELQSQIMSQNDIKSRLSQAEESLRQETLQNEEQRAYIKVLRENLDQKLNQMGLLFKNSTTHNTGFDSNVDGYMHLINQQRQIDQIQKENQNLLKQLQDIAIQNEQGEKAMLGQFQIKIEEVKQQHQNEINNHLTKISNVKQKKKQLKKDKNQLLDFVEESLKKQQQEENIKNELQDDIKRKESIISQLQQRLDDTKRDKLHQDDLIIQAQQNLKIMREQKEKLQLQQNENKKEIERLTIDVKDMREQLKTTEEALASTRRVANDLDRQLVDKTTTAQRLEIELERKEKELESIIRGQQEIGKEKAQLIDVLRNQLDEQTKKSYTLEDANIDLQRTLQQTQQEFDNLIKQYELLTKSHALQTNEFIVIKKQLQDIQQELDQRTRTYNDIKCKEDTLQKELEDVYGSLSIKQKVQKDQEQRMLKTLQEKDEELLKIINKYEQLEQQFQDQTGIIKQLERCKDDRDRETEKLKNTIDLKQNLIDDLKLQLIRTKAEFENQYLTTQRTLNLAQTDLERKDQEYQSKLSQTQNELSQLKQQKYLAEKVLGEKVEKTRQLESERIRLEEKLQRLESDIGKLEEKQGKDKERQGLVKDEVERIRSQRIDDAMLIEQLRQNLEDSKQQLNDIIGLLSTFPQYIDNIVQQCTSSPINIQEKQQQNFQDTNNLHIQDIIGSKEVNTLYEQLNGLKILKNNNEIVQSFSDIKQCLQSFIAYTKSLNNKLLNINNRTQTHAFNNNNNNLSMMVNTQQIFSGGQSLTHSPPQKDKDYWNIPQRIHNLNQQEYFGQDTNKIQTQQHAYSLGGTQEINQRIFGEIEIQLQQEKDKLSQCKQRIEVLEEISNLDKQHINELESLLRKLIGQKSIDPKLHRVMTDLYSNTRDLISLKSDKSSLTRQLIQKEQRYHTLNKAVNLQNDISMGPYQREIGLLKVNIERERQNVKELDLRIDEHQRRQRVLQEELDSIDQIIENRDYKQEIQTQGLQQENEELKKMVQKTRQDKEWAEKRFIELEEQLNRFNMPLSLSRIEKQSERVEEDRTELSPHQSIDNNVLRKDNSSARLQWPKQQQTQNNNAMPSQMYKRNHHSSDRKPEQDYTQKYQQLHSQQQQQQQYRTTTQSKANMPQLQQQSEQKYQNTSIDNNNNIFNMFRSYQNGFYNNQQQQQLNNLHSQEQSSLQLPTPNQAANLTHDVQQQQQLYPGYKRNNYDQLHYENQNNSYAGQINQSALRNHFNINPSQNIPTSHLQSIVGTEEGDQSTSQLKNKIQQVKTMFNQIRRNIDQ